MNAIELGVIEAGADEVGPAFAWTERVDGGRVVCATPDGEVFGLSRLAHDRAMAPFHALYAARPDIARAHVSGGRHEWLVSPTPLPDGGHRLTLTLRW